MNSLLLITLPRTTYNGWIYVVLDLVSVLHIIIYIHIYNVYYIYVHIFTRTNINNKILYKKSYLLPVSISNK